MNIFSLASTKCAIIIISALVFCGCRKESSINQNFQLIATNCSDDLRSVDFLDNNRGLIVAGISASSTQSNLLLTQTGGTSWELKICPIPNFIANLVFAFANTFYLQGSKLDGKNCIYRSTDDGQTWEFVHTLEGGRIYFSDSLNGIWSEGNTIKKTTDGGRTFTETYTSDNDGFLGFTQLQFMNSSIGFASGGIDIDGGMHSSIITTKDQGNSWTRLSVPDGYLTSLDFVSDKQGFAFYFPNLLYSTNDGGITWTLANDRVIRPVTSCYFISDQAGYAIGNDLLFSTNNGGKSWETIYENKRPDGSSMIQISPIPFSSSIIVIGHAGLILRN